MTKLFEAQQLAARYAQIVDNREFDKMRDIISADFCQTGPEWKIETADSFIAQLEKLQDNFLCTFHIVGNQLGRWINDRYEGETYSIASHIYEKFGARHKLDMAIRYQDHIRVIDDVYQYTRRDVDLIWTSDQPL